MNYLINLIDYSMVTECSLKSGEIKMADDASLRTDDTQNEGVIELTRYGTSVFALNRAWHRL